MAHAIWGQVDCRLAITDSPIGSQPEKTACPLHQDPTASFAVYADHAYCYGCRAKLGRMETLAYLLYGAWDKAALDKAFTVARKYTTDAVDAYRARVDESVTTEPLPLGLALAYNDMLSLPAREHRRVWLHDRGLTDATIDDFNLGHDGTRFTIPVYSTEYHLLTLRFRRDDYYGTTQFDARRGEDRAIPKYSGLPGRNGLFLFGAHRLTWRDVWVVVVEGELDAIRLWQAGIPAVSPTNGAGNVAKVPALLKRDFPQIQCLFFATDQDEPGVTASMEGHAAAVHAGFQSTRLTWDMQWGKDVTDLYLGGHALQDAIYDGDEVALP